MDLPCRLALHNYSFSTSEDRLWLFRRTTVWLEDLSPNSVNEADVLTESMEKPFS